MSLQTQPFDDDEPRRAAIMAAATECFARYGFKRTSMEDIATAAGMSRPALYQYYRNKQDIFRSLVLWYFDATMARVAAALKPGLDPEVALSAAFEAKMGPDMKLLLESPHGQELMDANFSIAADIATRGEAEIARLIANWLASEAQAGRILLPDGDAAASAQILVVALGGLKTPGTPYDEIRARLDRLAKLFGRGLRK